MIERGRWRATLPCLLIALLQNGCPERQGQPDGGTDECTDSEGDTGSETGYDTNWDLDCDGGRLDPETNRCWQHPPEPDHLAWQEGFDLCMWALERAGHDDWFLPTLDDFESLLGGCDVNVQNGDWGYCSSCAESSKCTAMFGADESCYWTVTAVGNNVYRIVDLGNGLVSDDHAVYEQNVRCIR